jgi:Penicillin binding protein transpeptidase domain/Transglycosylase
MRSSTRNKGFTRYDKQLRNRSIDEQNLFEKKLGKIHGLDGDSDETTLVLLRCFNSLRRLTTRLHLGWMPRSGHLKLRLASLPKRLTLQGIAAVVLITSVPAALITYGYFKNDDAFYRQLNAQRTLNPILNEKGSLLGAVGLHANAAKGAELFDQSFIPTDPKDVPELFVKTLLALEDRHFENQLRTICGIDVPSFFWRIASSGLTAGGSGLVAMTVKQVLANGGETKILDRGIRYLTNLGAGCRLYRSMMSNQKPDAFLSFSASFLPMAQGNGTLRGITGAAYTFFDKPPNELDDWQLIFLASAVKRQIGVAGENDNKVACTKFFPMKNNPEFDPTLIKDKSLANRRNLCLTLARAKNVTPKLLPHERAESVIAKLQSIEQSGIAPANSFKRIPSSKLINLSTRTHATLSPDLIRLMRSEIEAYDFALGEPIFVGISANAQTQFNLQFKNKLNAIQQSASSRQFLCIPLAPSNSVVAAPVLARCDANQSNPYRPAEVLAIKVDVISGGVRLIYSTNPNLLNSAIFIASIAKWIPIVAAVDMGLRETEMLCPKSVTANGVPLRRVTRPAEGFADCTNGKNLISLRDATARSDNLAFYQLAVRIGPKRLADAAAKLGFNVPPDISSLPFQVAFGTFSATPAQVVAATQALMGAAYNLKVTGETPRVLAQVQTNPSKATAAVKRIAVDQSKRLVLQTLLQAPVANDGTLARAKVSAGKTGTGSSSKRDSTGRPYIFSKFVTAFNDKSMTIDFILIASSTPSEPLARHDIPTPFFRSAQDLVFSASVN